MCSDLIFSFPLLLKAITTNYKCAYAANGLIEELSHADIEKWVRAEDRKNHIERRRVGEGAISQLIHCTRSKSHFKKTGGVPQVQHLGFQSLLPVEAVTSCVGEGAISHTDMEDETFGAVGYKFKRQFDGVWFDGVVVKILDTGTFFTNNCQTQYNIIYMVFISCDMTQPTLINSIYYRPNTHSQAEKTTQERRSRCKRSAVSLSRRR